MFQKMILVIVFFPLFANASMIISKSVSDKFQVQNAVDVILYFGDQADLSSTTLLRDRTTRIQWVKDQLLQVATISQKDIRKFLEMKKIRYQSFYIENAIYIPQLTKLIFSELKDFSGIKRVGLNVHANIILPEVEYFQGGLDFEANEIPDPIRQIRADKVWSELNVKGSGIVLGGQDTGYRWTHETIKNSYRGTKLNNVDHDYNWHDAVRDGNSWLCDVNSEAPCDDNGHGTHTMGTMIGQLGDEKQFGVAPEAQWIGCRNMNSGRGTVARYLECFEFFLTPYPVGGSAAKDGRADMAPHIINNSWGCPSREGCGGEEFLSAIRNLKEAGIATVVAAGNSGPSCGTVADPPGMYAGEVLSVGAYNGNQKDIAYFSSVGPSSWNGQLAPNLVAPGSSIYSATHRSDSSYSRKSGTSMASPHVAGALALLWSARPELIGEVDASFELLQQSAMPLLASKNCQGFPGNTVPNAVFGYGMLDIYNAIQMAK